MNSEECDDIYICQAAFEIFTTSLIQCSKTREYGESYRDFKLIRGLIRVIARNEHSHCHR